MTRSTRKGVPPSVAAAAVVVAATLGFALASALDGKDIEHLTNERNTSLRLVQLAMTRPPLSVPRAIPVNCTAKSPRVNVYLNGSKLELKEKQ